MSRGAEPAATAPGDGDGAALRGRRVVLGICGGIAAYKAGLLARLLVGRGADTTAVLTEAAREFVGPATFAGLTGNPVPGSLWDQASRSHVELARSADAIVVYPATAHLLARAASGLADDLLTTVLLAATCPVVMAPAMHTGMWEHAATVDNAATLRQRGVVLVGPDEGELMAGDVGVGRAVEPAAVVRRVAGILAAGGELAGRRIVVTAGGTREPFDPVRFLGNPSTGRMGFAIAAAAARRGAEVDLIAAPTHLATPHGVDRRDVTTAEEMHREVLAAAEGADVVIKAAAVADFRPAEQARDKLKKREVPGERLTVELVRNPDILAELGARDRDGGPLLVGFAAETRDPEANGRRKLEDKGADLLVVNDVSAEGAGFASDDNAVLILGADGSRIEIGLSPKWHIAERVLAEIADRLG